MTDHPIKIFEQWFSEAKNCKEINDATEFCLATATKEGRPSARIVLLKKFDERGFCFFTNYNGRKSQEILSNPHAAICFYWNPLKKQIRIEGRVEKLSTEESDEYFKTRPDESKLGAWASKQSSALPSREEFFSAIEKYKDEFHGKEIKRPDFWGGWRIVPERIEFWQAEKFRYHKRLIYIKQGDNWVTSLLYP